MKAAAIHPPRVPAQRCEPLIVLPGLLWSGLPPPAAWRGSRIDVMSVVTVSASTAMSGRMRSANPCPSHAVMLVVPLVALLPAGQGPRRGGRHRIIALSIAMIAGTPRADRHSEQAMVGSSGRAGSAGNIWRAQGGAAAGSHGHRLCFVTTAAAMCWRSAARRAWCSCGQWSSVRLPSHRFVPFDPRVWGMPRAPPLRCATPGGIRHPDRRRLVKEPLTHGIGAVLRRRCGASALG